MMKKVEGGGWIMIINNVDVLHIEVLRLIYRQRAHCIARVSGISHMHHAFNALAMQSMPILDVAAAAHVAVATRRRTRQRSFRST
jgi:hypothetical protein